MAAKISRAGMGCQLQRIFGLPPNQKVKSFLVLFFKKEQLSLRYLTRCRGPAGGLFGDAGDALATFEFSPNLGWMDLGGDP